MSWETRVVGLITLVWGMLAVLYATVIGMPTGARAWGAGALLFAGLLAALLRAERQGVRRQVRG